MNRKCVGIAVAQPRIAAALITSLLMGVAAAAQEAPAVNRAIGDRDGVANPAIAAALTWLKSQQDESGAWAAGETAAGSLGPVGVTALVMLAYLGAGTTLRVGPYCEELKHGTKWLRDQQDVSTGSFGDAGTPPMEQALAALAMTECHGLSQYKLLRKSVVRGVGQLEELHATGLLWASDANCDAWASCWGLIALSSARRYEIPVADEVWDAATTWLREMVDAKSGLGRGVDDPVAFPARSVVSLGNSAVMLEFLVFGGATTLGSKTAADVVTRQLPQWQPGRGVIDPHGWYWSASAAYQLGDDVWHKWARCIDAEVVKNQRTDGDDRGSWDPVDLGAGFGRTGTTALIVLMLEARYCGDRIK